MEAKDLNIQIEKKADTSIASDLTGAFTGKTIYVKVLL